LKNIAFDGEDKQAYIGVGGVWGGISANPSVSVNFSKGNTYFWNGHNQHFLVPAGLSLPDKALVRDAFIWILMEIQDTSRQLEKR